MPPTCRSNTPSSPPGARPRAPGHQRCKRHRETCFMCGIAGIIASDHLAEDDHARALLMRDVLTHRGPDGAGLYADPHALLAHRRLSIVDLAGGHQPLANETGSI